MRKYSKSILVTFIILIIFYVVLQVFKVHLIAAYDLSVRLYLFIISILAIVFSSKIFRDKIFRVISFLSTMFVFISLFRFIGLHTVSVHLFFDQKSKVFQESVSILNDKKYSDFRYFSINNGELRGRDKIVYDDKKLGILIDELGVEEIFVTNFSNEKKILFSVYRFIDNGHGYLYSDKELGERISIDGLQITGYVKLGKNWYAVSYT